MPSYVVLMKFTAQAVTGIKDVPEGTQRAIRQFQEVGGAIKGLYVTMGEYDMVAVVEAPSDEVLMAYALQLASYGNVRTKTLKAFSVEAFSGWIKNLPENDD